MEKTIIVGLDIGTTKIGVIVGEIDEYNELNIKGVGVSPSDGLRKGVVINIDKTVNSIKQAMEEAELMAGIEVDEVYVGIAGDHIRSFNSKGQVAISNSENGISPEDVQRVIEHAKAIHIPQDREVIHVIPQEFIVDDQTGIREPVGMSGVRLEVEAHIVTGLGSAANNIYKAVEKAGYVVKDLVLEPLASSYAVLTEDEKELGVGLLDLGGGTTDLAIFFDDSIRYTSVTGLGGKNVTQDIAIGIRTPVEKAEEIKRKFGLAMASLARKDSYIEVPGVGGRENKEVSRSVLASIIEPRVEEIFSLVAREIKNSGYAEMLGAGLVLTGGAAQLEGIVELAEQVFNMPVRMGKPKGFGGLSNAAANPAFATGVGLVMYGHQNLAAVTGPESRKTGAGIRTKIIQLVKEYF
jgi:cell division protein FtsA